MKRNFAFAAITICTAFFACSPASDSRYTSWQVTGGSKENIRYSTLDQIDTTNVNQLKAAWVYHSLDADTVHHSQIQCNPIIVDGVLYATSPELRLLALDAATGKEKWVFNPHTSGSKEDVAKIISLNNNRGVTYWSDEKEKRIFYSAGSYLFAVDASTGKLIPSFGIDGKVELHEGLGRDVKDLYVASTSPGIIYKDLIIMGTRVSESSNAAPGHIRAYDVHTGKQRWIFHTIPQPGELGYDSWEDSTAYKHVGGANAWSGFSLDEKRGMLFAPTGSAVYDFYGGMRKGANLFSNSILALDAATGKYIWHYQTIHHDVWDKDIPTPPCLITLTVEGKKVDAIAQPTKTAFVFVLDRETGKPIFPIEELPVPTDTKLKGEKLWPTQPFPSKPKPFVRQSMTVNDLNNLVPDSSYQDIKKRFLGFRSDHLYAPPSKEGTISFPGLDGGAEWGGSAFDPATGLLYVNANEIPWLITLKEVQAKAAEKENYLQAGQRLYSQNCMACHGADRMGTGNNPTILQVSKTYNEKTFSELLAGGRRMMPAFKNLSTQETEAIASFVLDNKRNQKKAFAQTPAAIDSFIQLPYTLTGYLKFTTKEGYPASRPPWGTLNAINLQTGETAWKIPLGEYPEFKKQGIISGTENYGGPVVTSTGLVFIAATRDGKFRAFNKITGRLLWETELPAPGFATPSMYEVNGKQYIVIACGGGKLNTKSGDAYVAFALP
ncbi:MAG TPA: PQQ-binding-like beta-propeller repeat protein [Cyclobacteriaceae bacterium]|nr:PQQ-binding-like beta-propeller repeat protein [Cyclobacteriaceae bacterium]